LRVIVLSGYGVEIGLSRYVGQVGRLYQSHQCENDERHFERRFRSRFFQRRKPKEVKPVATALPFLFCFGFVVRGAKHDAASLRPAARIGAARRVIAALDQFTDSIFKQPRLRHCERGEAIHEATRKQEWIASLRSQ
jgi:hypothetical protein